MTSTSLDVRSDWTPRTLYRRRGFRLARQLDRLMPEPAKTYTIFETETSQATRLGADLVDLDRELRRATVVLAGSMTVRRHIPSPLPVSEGGLTIREVDVGSTETLVEAYGVVRDLLLSHPLQLLLTTQALRHNAAVIRAWFRQELPGVSVKGLREVMEILRHGPPSKPRSIPKEASPASAPRSRSDLKEATQVLVAEEREPDGSELRVELRGPHPTRQRRIRHLREHSDGIEYIEIEETEW